MVVQSDVVLTFSSGETCSIGSDGPPASLVVLSTRCSRPRSDLPRSCAKSSTQRRTVWTSSRGSNGRGLLFACSSADADSAGSPHVRQR